MDKLRTEVKIGGEKVNIFLMYQTIASKLMF